MRNIKGFTLIELIVVLLIISVLTWYWLPIIMDLVNRPTVIKPIRELLENEASFYQQNQLFSVSSTGLNRQIPSFLALESKPNALFVFYIPSENLSYIKRPLFETWRSRHIRSYELYSLVHLLKQCK